MVEQVEIEIDAKLVAEAKRLGIDINEATLYFLELMKRKVS